MTAVQEVHFPNLSMGGRFGYKRRVPEITLTKLDVAERQLRQAIRLLFGGGDEVSVHTLTCAASGVLRGLGTQKGIESPLRAAVTIHVYPEKQAEAFRLMSAAQNYFKHADRDADESLTFSPEATVYLLLEACLVHSHLTGYYLTESYVFFVWFWLKHPHVLKDGPLKAFFTSPQAKSFNPDYLDVVLDLIDWLRRTKGDRIPMTGTPIGE